MTNAQAKKDYIKAQIQYEIELNEFILDYINEPMSELENQISCVFDNDYICIHDYLKNKYTTCEKVKFLVDEWKDVGLIEAFINCELYAKHFNFHKDLNEDEYNILAIKYIVKNNLV
nr:MAG: hypothetical protein [Lake Baikal virophage 13]